VLVILNLGGRGRGGASYTTISLRRSAASVNRDSKSSFVPPLHYHAVVGVSMFSDCKKALEICTHFKALD